MFGFEPPFFATVATLPEPGKRNVLVTSALPYVSNVPHLGNLIGFVLSGDVFARYCRGRGVTTLFIGGTDNYGTTTEMRAILEGCTPMELCNKYHIIHASIYQWFNISFDVFGQTATEPHTKITQDIFLKLDKNGLLKECQTTQLYCTKHRSFLADRFVQWECQACGYPDACGDQCAVCDRLSEPLELRHPWCKMDGSTPITKKMNKNHIFLRLDKLEPEIETFVHKSTTASAWSDNSTAITLAWLKDGLEPRSITRDITWGTKVPPSGYDDKDVQLYQFIGQDNTLSHSIIFPATQLGTREPWTQLHHLSATQYLTYKGGKFSKSRGIGVFGDAAQKTGVPSDVWRSFLVLHRPETSDSEFTWDAFISDNNTLLLQNLGHFVHRVVALVAFPSYYGVHQQTALHRAPSDPGSLAR